MKVKTCISIESEILKTAQELGLNISKFCEFALSQAIRQISSLNFKEGIGNAVSDMVRPPGFEPGSSAWQIKGLNNAFSGSLKKSLEVFDWDAFREWLLRDHKPHTVVSMVTYAKQYAHCLETMNLSELLTVRETLRANILKALSSLAKYLGVYEEYRKALKNYGLTWSGKQADQLLIERITKVRDPGEIWEWVKNVKKARPELADFMDFISITGLRLEEAVNSYNLIINLSRKNKLNEYYNETNECLEHFKFKEYFIRKSKKAFISFVPRSLVERIGRNRPFKSKFGIQKRVKLASLPLKFADIREAHATTLTRHLNQNEIDFLHGRVGTSVFMQNYFNPALISDLKDRVFKGITEIKDKVKIL